MRKNFWSISLSILAIILLVIICPIIISYILKSLNIENLEKTGQFGDTYGVLNSVLSGITLIIVLFSNKKQSEQIEQDKEESSKKTEIENFLKLIDLHIAIINSASQGSYVGKICIYKAIENHAKNQLQHDASNVSYNGFRLAIKNYYKSLAVISKYISEARYSKDFFKEILYPHLIGNELTIIDKIDITDNYRNNIKVILNELKDDSIIILTK